MQTEFTCGIHKAVFNEIGGHKWFLNINTHTLGIIEQDGSLIMFTNPPKYFSTRDFSEIKVLMKHIERQYKQLQTTS
jgi:hypothetical protein